MAVLPACLELTISVPGFTSSPSLPSSGEEGRGGMRDLDMNQTPLREEEKEWGNTISMELQEEEEEEEEESKVPRKKLRLTKEQSLLLEESFRHNHTLNPKEKEGLARKLKLKARQVEVWFQNRRARIKLKQTEIECEYLKRWFGSLTEQNRRLQKEVEHLRAMKVGPPTVMTPHTRQPLQASTLSMCPRCECVTTTGLDKGPTKTTTTTTTTTKPTTLSPKVPIHRQLVN